MNFMMLCTRGAAIAAVLGLAVAAGSAQAQGTKAVFYASGPNSGSDLWITDGTPTGTVQIPVSGIPSYGLVNSGSGGPDFTFLNGSALFVGQDNVGRSGLWTTNGTQSGTSELVIPGAPTCGIFCSFGATPDFTILGSRALFKAKDAATGTTNLWTTDGTVAGTSELVVPGAGSNGILASYSDPELTVIGNKAFFITNNELWTTDGTGNGTAAVNASGLNSFAYHPDLTIFGSSTIIFAGTDSNYDANPFVSDGTGAGTVEILAQGASTSNFVRLVNPEFTVLGSKVLFLGADANNHLNLWATDGTSVGTVELTPSGAFAGGFFGGPGTTYLEPDFTVFGSVVVFSGYDNLGIPSLWVTDGTTAGTVEITVSGASPKGLFSDSFGDNGEFGPNFTVLGNKLLFAGMDANQHLNLWVTNGTAAGTQELLVPAAYSNGLIQTNSINGTGHFAVLNNKVLFVGNGQNNFDQLWTSDGTVAGTISLGAFNPFDVTPLVRVITGPLPTSLAAAVAPGSRSVEVPGPATVFATMVNTGNAQLTNCQVSLPASAPSSLSLSYQATNPTTNALIGTPNTPVSIAANGIQTFILSFGSGAPLTDPGQAVNYSCAESQPAPNVVGVNTVDLLFSATSIPDIIALAATATNDLTIHLSNDIGAFGVASINVGAAGNLTVSTDTGSATLPISVTACQTTATGQCIAPPAASVPVTFPAGAVPTFSIFVSASAPVAFAPGTSRIFVRFKDSNGVSHGATSVAVTTN